MGKRRTKARDAAADARVVADAPAAREATPATTPVAPAPGRFRSALLDYVPLGVVVVVVALIHVWIISAGHMWPSKWPLYSGYYGLLADAFAPGQLHLTVSPDARLMALPDPYDPYANEGLRFHDAVLFDGKYYLYWGPVPALMLLPFIPGGPRAPMPDAYVLLAMTEWLVIGTAATLAAVRRRYFPRQSRYTLCLMTLAAGLAMPLPYLLARAAVYEASIVAAQAFLITGIFFAFTAFATGVTDDGAAATAPPSRRAGRPALPLPPPGVVRLILAGTCWALAVGCRASLAPPVIALAGLVALRIWWRGTPPTPPRDGGGVARLGRRLNWRALVAFGAPLAAGAILLASYNYARFGSFTEFGQRYQLAAVPIRDIGERLFSAENVGPSLPSYLHRPWQILPKFPFIMARKGLESLPPGIVIPPYYHTEEIVGIAWTTPLFLLLAVPVALLGRRVVRVVTLAGTPAGASAPPADAARDAGVSWLVVCLLTASALAFAPVLLLVGSTMRYFADLTPPLFIAAAIGLWQLERMLAGRRAARIGVLALATGLAAYGIAVAWLLSILGYSLQFVVHNRPLFDRLVRLFGG